MGKSPGRWIKTVLFGKKYSKSNLAKNAISGKKAAVRIPAEDVDGNSSVISDPRQLINRCAENVEIENDTSGVPCDDTVALSPVNQGAKTQSNFVFSVPESDAEMRKQYQAATKVQAALKGYLARRAFRALKGIIRLQALIRGHLVRRQAVATLRCMQAVVKFQALARRRIVRLSHAIPETGRNYSTQNPQVAKQVDIGANSIFAPEKLGRKPYIRKLLVLLPTAIPLGMQYDVDEPNSASNWLQRWSFSRFWVLPARPKPVSDVKPRRSHGGSLIAENEPGKSKRCIRKASGAEIGDNLALARIQRKVTSHQKDLVQVQPQNELERVKRNLRKVSASSMAPSEKSETETDKPQKQPTDRNLSKHGAPDVSEQEIVISSINQADSHIAAIELASTEVNSKSLAVDESQNVPHDDCTLVETRSSENGKMDSTPSYHEELSSKEEETGKENQKIGKRRSLLAKQEYPENISQNTPSLPSYMAATESAKAKLRAQGSPKFSDGAEYGYVRRHSLPASTNGRLSSLSPRMQKPVQANGKGSSKTDRSMTTSRDDKILQPGWRR